MKIRDFIQSFFIDRIHVLSMPFYAVLVTYFFLWVLGQTSWIDFIGGSFSAVLVSITVQTEMFSSVYVQQREGKTLKQLKKKGFQFFTALKLFCVLLGLTLLSHLSSIPELRVHWGLSIGMFVGISITTLEFVLFFGSLPWRWRQQKNIKI